MVTYVLIIVLSTGYQSGLATLTQEFNTFETCEIARKHTVDGMNKYHHGEVHSHGCFKK